MKHLREIDGLPPAERLIAHRGWPDRYPENSLEGIAAVLEAGARAVEFDVQLTADGQPVVIHDDLLKRLIGCSGSVTQSTRRSLAGLRIKGPNQTWAAIPDLSAVLETVAGFPQAQAFIEIKAASIRRFGREKTLAAVMECLHRFTCPHVLLSFDARIAALARARGVTRIGWVFKPWTSIARITACWLKPDYLFVRASRIPPWPKPFWKGRWKWVIYGVDSPPGARRLMERGAALVETDDWLAWHRALLDRPG